MKKLTKEKLNKLEKLYKENEEAEEKASDLLKEARKNGDNKLKVERKDKDKKVKVKESDLWDEVWHLGADCNAAKALKEKYPEVFEAFKKQNKKAQELRDYSIKEIGIDYRKIKLIDIFNIAQAVVDYNKEE